MFVHLHCHSPFSFLDGADSVERLVAQAAMLGMPAMALTDHDTIAGLPSFHHWANVYGIKPISGSELTLSNGTHVTLLAENAQGYQNMCQLLTLANGQNGEYRKFPRVPETSLFAHSEGLILLSGCRRSQLIQHLLHHRWECAQNLVKNYRDVFESRFYLELQGDDFPRARAVNQQIAQLGSQFSLPLVATTNVHYTDAHHYPVHDILRCIHLHSDIYTPHFERPLNARRYLHDSAEAERRFANYPSAIANTVAIAERCQVVVELNATHLPTFQLPDSMHDAGMFLRDLVFQGAKERYGKLTNELKNRLEYELQIITVLGYVDYFIIVWDIVRFSRSQRIRCTGRGSAADSAIAYCLYITDVYAAGRGLLFERFMSLERAEKPDIDVDFDSTRRDEVMSYVYRTYGSDKAARNATYQTF